MSARLSDAKVRNARPKSRPYKISDGEGLFLLVTASGAKYWRLKYFFGGKEKLLAVGVYPDVSLADARDRRAQARKVLAAGSDPGLVKQEAKRLARLKNGNAFETVAREWLEKRKHEWAANTAELASERLEKYVLPELGARSIADIKAPEVLTVLRSVENRGLLVTARRVMQMTRQIFTYAIATGRAVRNPVPDLRGALKSPVVKHRCYLKENELPEYLQKLEAYDGVLQTELDLTTAMVDHLA